MNPPLIWGLSANGGYAATAFRNGFAVPFDSDHTGFTVGGRGELCLPTGDSFVCFDAGLDVMKASRDLQPLTSETLMLNIGPGAAWRVPFAGRFYVQFLAQGGASYFVTDEELPCTDNYGRGCTNDMGVLLNPDHPQLLSPNGFQAGFLQGGSEIGWSSDRARIGLRLATGLITDAAGDDDISASYTTVSVVGGLTIKRSSTYRLSPAETDAGGTTPTEVAIDGLGRDDMDEVGSATTGGTPLTIEHAGDVPTGAPVIKMPPSDVAKEVEVIIDGQRLKFRYRPVVTSATPPSVSKTTGGAVTITGKGFDTIADKTVVVMLDNSGKEVGRITTPNVTSTTSLTAEIPASAFTGRTKIKLRVVVNGIPAANTPEITGTNASYTLEKTTGKASGEENSITITGAPGITSVTIEVPGATPVPATVTSGKATFKMPPHEVGKVTLTVKDVTGGKSIVIFSPPYEYTTPELTTDKLYIPPAGGAFELKGTGFSQGNTTVVITRDDTTTIAPITANVTDQGTLTFTIDQATVTGSPLAKIQVVITKDGKTHKTNELELARDVIVVVVPPTEIKVTTEDSGKTLVGTADVQFTPGSARLTPAGKATIVKAKEWLKSMSDKVKAEGGSADLSAYTLEIRGYTSQTGPKASNERLSLRRAKAVEKELQRLLRGTGINISISSPVGRGEDKPVVHPEITPDTPDSDIISQLGGAGRSRQEAEKALDKNRRVEFAIRKK